MMPTLIAEESLRAAERVAVGTGALKPEDQRAVRRRWREEAGRLAPRQARKVTPAQLAAMGIGVHVVETRS